MGPQAKARAEVSNEGKRGGRRVGAAFSWRENEKALL